MGSKSSKQKSSKNEQPVSNYADVNKPQLLKVFDLMSRGTPRMNSFDKNNAIGFLKSIESLRQELRLVKTIDENSEFIPSMSDVWFNSILGSVETSLDLLRRVVKDLDDMINIKAGKIDKNLDFTFKRFLGKNNSTENLQGRLEHAKLYAVKLFKPVLEELYKNPILRALVLGSQYKSHPDFLNFKKMIVSSGKNAINIIDGNIKEFAADIEQIYDIFNNFLNLGYSMTFEEIRTEYEKMDNYSKYLQRISKSKLSSRALEHFRVKEEIQYNMSDNIKFAHSSDIFDSKDPMFMVRFDDKDSKYLVILVNLHNFMVDLQNSKEILSKCYLKKNDLIEEIDTYLKLSNKLSEIIIRMESGGSDKLGGNAQTYDKPSCMVWVIIICVVLIIIVVIFLWSAQHESMWAGAEKTPKVFPRNITFAK